MGSCVFYVAMGGGMGITLAIGHIALSMGALPLEGQGRRVRVASLSRSTFFQPSSNGRLASGFNWW
jgi:hypothetical protein